MMNLEFDNLVNSIKQLQAKDRAKLLAEFATDIATIMDTDKTQTLAKFRAYAASFNERCGPGFQVTRPMLPPIVG